MRKCEYRDTEIMMLYVNMTTKTTTYSSSHPCPMSMWTMKIQGWERSPCCRCVGLMLYDDDRWYMMCILRELATAISVQITSVRQWVWSNTVQNEYGTVSLHGAIVKITENRVIVNVYLQELCYILLVMNLWGITVKYMVYVFSLYLYEALHQWLRQRD